MKAIIITNKLDEQSGWGRYSLSLVKCFVEKEIEVLVICNQVNYDHENIKQISILPSPLSFKKVQFLSFFYLISFLIKEGFKFGRPDFVHCFVEPYSFFTYLTSKILRTKYFLTIHGSYGVKGLENRLYRALQLFSYKKASKIFCVSNYTKKRILGYKELLNIEIIPNGIDGDSFCELSGEKKENILIGVGGLKKRKGYDMTIKALEIAKKQIPNIKYIIVGDQQDIVFFKYLKKLVRELKLENNIFFYKNITDKKLKNLYKKSKLFVLTPVSDQFNFEGFGLVYLEANACGLPVVGSYDNGGEDAIKNGYNGFLTKPNDEKDIAEKILKILQDDVLYLNMSKNALKWSSQLQWKIIFNKYLSFYE